MAAAGPSSSSAAGRSSRTSPRRPSISSSSRCTASATPARSALRVLSAGARSGASAARRGPAASRRGARAPSACARPRPRASRRAGAAPRRCARSRPRSRRWRRRTAAPPRRRRVPRARRRRAHRATGPGRPTARAAPRAASPSASRHDLAAATSAPAGGTRRPGGDDQAAGSRSRITMPRTSSSARPRSAISSRMRVEVGFTADGARDRGRGLQAAHRALELVPPPLAVRVEPGVLERDRRPFGEDHDGFLVVGGERVTAGLVAEVEVPPRLTADHDRHAEERLHPRMARRGSPLSAGRRRSRRAAAAAGRRSAPRGCRARAAGPRSRACSPVDRPCVRKRSSPVRLLVEDAQRRVARAGDLGRGLEHAVEDRLHVELGDDRAPGVEQTPERVVIEERRSTRRHFRLSTSTWSARAASITTLTGSADAAAGLLVEALQVAGELAAGDLRRRPPQRAAGDVGRLLGPAPRAAGSAPSARSAASRGARC